MKIILNLCAALLVLASYNCLALPTPDVTTSLGTLPNATFPASGTTGSLPSTGSATPDENTHAFSDFGSELDNAVSEISNFWRSFFPKS